MNVVVVCHVHFLRDALIETLHCTGDIHALGAFSHESAELAMTASPPSLVVIDSSHPEGIKLVSVIRARLPNVAVVVLSMRESDEEFLAWAGIGIAGYLGPDTSVSSLVSALRRVAAGDVICTPRLNTLLLTKFANRSADSSRDRIGRANIDALTPREREIAALLAEGMSNKLIARRLSVALPTVKNHVHSILDKWDVRSRGEAAARYRQKSAHSIAPAGNRTEAVRASHVAQMGGATLRHSDGRSGMVSSARDAA